MTRRKPQSDDRGEFTYIRIADEIAKLIASGTLRAGQRLPSVRMIAQQRRVSANSAVQALVTLENRGLVEARPRSGFYVRNTPLPARARAHKRHSVQPLDATTNDLVTEVIATNADSAFIPLGAGDPAASLFPTKRLGLLLSSAARKQHAWAGSFATNVAYEPFAREIARRYLAIGAGFSHEGIIATSGCTEALNLAIRACTREGDTVAIESPVWFGLPRIIRNLGRALLEIPSHPETGLDLRALRQTLARRRVAALVVSPCHQSPTGACMPDGSKNELAALATKHELPIIEDDTYGELSFETTRPRPLKAWDSAGNVLLCSSLGKTLAPGWRLGWLEAGRFRARAHDLKLHNSGGAPLVLQKAAADFLREGGFDRHVRALRQRYRENVARWSRGIARHLPHGTTVASPTGGSSIWVTLPGAIDATELLQRCLAEKIALAPGPVFSAAGSFSNFLRFNACRPYDERVDAALRKVGRIASDG